MDAAMGSPFPPATVNGEPADSSRGDPAGALAAAPTRIEQTYRRRSRTTTPWSRHATIAAWDAAGEQLTLYSATQGVWPERKAIAARNWDPRPQRSGRDANTWGVASGARAHPGRTSCWLPWRRNPSSGRSSWCSPAPRCSDRSASARGPCSESRSGRPPMESSRDSARRRVADVRALTNGSSRLALTNAWAVCLSERRNVTPDGARQRRHPLYMRAPGEADRAVSRVESALDELAYACASIRSTCGLRNYADRDEEQGTPLVEQIAARVLQTGAERFDWARRTPEAAVHARRATCSWVSALGLRGPPRPGQQGRRPRSAHGRRHVTVQSGDTGHRHRYVHDHDADRLRCARRAVARRPLRAGDTELPETPVSAGSQTATSTGQPTGACDDLRPAPSFSSRSPIRRRCSTVPIPAAVDARDGRLVARGDSSRGVTYRELLSRSGCRHLEWTGGIRPGNER